MDHTKNICLLLLVSATLWSSAHAAADGKDKPTVATLGGGEVPAWKGEPLEGEFAANYSVNWHYPVFKGGDKARVEKLNSWARTQSLTALVQFDEVWLSKFLASRDSGVLKLLQNNKAARDSVGTQSELQSRGQLGKYIIFNHYTEWLGQARPWHGIDHPIFNYETGQPVETKSLFTPDAEAELTELLKVSIEDSFKESLKVYKQCQAKSKNSKEQPCIPALDQQDIEFCWRQRSFNWRAVSIGHQGSIDFEFPYVPNEFSTCGEGMYSLPNKSIRKFLIFPQDFGQEFHN
jgi:hypothetical protein